MSHARDAAAPGRTLTADGLLRARRATYAGRGGALGLERADALPGGCHTPTEPSNLEQSSSVEVETLLRRVGSLVAQQSQGRFISGSSKPKFPFGRATNQATLHPICSD